HVSTETVSGQIAMAVDSRSSFELSYSSHSGDFRNDLSLDVKRAPKRKHGGVGGWLEAVYGKGEGVIECDAFSGDLQIRNKYERYRSAAQERVDLPGALRAGYGLDAE